MRSLDSARNDKGGSVLILVQFDVEDFPLSYADAGMAALMGLVAVLTTKVLHRSVIRDFNLIDGKETEALAAKTLVRILTCASACLGETILA